MEDRLNTVGDVSTPALTPRSAYVAGLDNAQSDAVLSPAAVLAILAGAGSGKTRVLTHRIARRIADGSATPKHVMAVTFTTKAASEMRSRLRVLLGEELFPVRPRAFTPRPSAGPAVHTLHALGYSLLNRYAADRDQRRRHVTHRRHDLLAGTLKDVGESRLTVGPLEAEIEWAKARALSPRQYLAAAEDQRRVVGADGQLVDLEVVARAFEQYEQTMRRRQVMDVDDLIVEAVRVLENDSAFRAAQGYWHRHVFVDEYQDLNPAQFRLLRALVGDNPDLCVVGDPNQAIYGWNGADPNLLTDFNTYFPSAQVLHLEANYRCRRPIVAAAATVLDLNTPDVRPEAESGAVPTLWSFQDAKAEGEAVARAVQELSWRYGERGIAVLAPMSSQLDAVAVALRDRRIPFERAGSSLLARPEVRRVLDYLRRFPLARMGMPLRQLSFDIGDLCERSARDLPLDDPAGWDGLDADGYPVVRGLSDDDPTFILNRASLDTLVELLEEFEKALPDGDLQAFEGWAGVEVSKREAGLRGKGVALSTIHRAKGLEWSVVFVVGCVDGALPSRRARTREARQESRRLTYVALTRASDELFCTWARIRQTRWGGIEHTSPSPFLKGLPQADGAGGIRSAEPAETPVDRNASREALRRCRLAIGGTSESR